MTNWPKISTMLAVSNTSPISNLASADRLVLLKSQFSTVSIPHAVANELATHPDPAAREAIQNAIREGWLRIESAQDSLLLKILLLQLHSGEAEGIALPTDLKADIVLIDEQEGRQLAQRLALPSLAFLAFCCAPSARARLQR